MFYNIVLISTKHQHKSAKGLNLLGKGIFLLISICFQSHNLTDMAPVQLIKKQTLRYWHECIILNWRFVQMEWDINLKIEINQRSFTLLSDCLCSPTLPHQCLKIKLLNLAFLFKNFLFLNKYRFTGSCKDSIEKSLVLFTQFLTMVTS